MMMGGIIGDVVHNLRSALDHLAVALVIRNGRTSKTAIDDTYFPISATQRGFEEALRKRLGNASGPAKSLVKHLKPYQGGTEAFWRLHKLDTDKHKMLVPVASVSDAVHAFFPSISHKYFAGRGHPPFVLTPTRRVAFGDVIFAYDRGAVLKNSVTAKRSTSPTRSEKTRPI